MAKKAVQVCLLLIAPIFLAGCKNSLRFSSSISDLKNNLVSLHTSNGTSCYGVKVGSDKILTAAHCLIYTEGDFYWKDKTRILKPRSFEIHSKFFRQFFLGFFNCLKRADCSEANFLKELFKVGLPDFAIIYTSEKFSTWLEAGDANFSLPLFYFSTAAEAIVEVENLYISEPFSLLSYSLISPICKGSSGLPLLQYQGKLKIVGVASMGLTNCKIFSPSVFSLVDTEVKTLIESQPKTPNVKKSIN